MKINRYVNGEAVRKVEKTVVGNAAVRSAMEEVNRRIREETAERA